MCSRPSSARSLLHEQQSDRVYCASHARVETLRRTLERAVHPVRVAHQTAEPRRDHDRAPHRPFDVCDDAAERPELACAARPAMLPAAEDVAPDPLELVTP